MAVSGRKRELYRVSVLEFRCFFLIFCPNSYQTFCRWSTIQRTTFFILKKQCGSSPTEALGTSLESTRSLMIGGRLAQSVRSDGIAPASLSLSVATRPLGGPRDDRKGHCGQTLQRRQTGQCKRCCFFEWAENLFFLMQASTMVYPDGPRLSVGNRATAAIFLVFFFRNDG